MAPHAVFREHGPAWENGHPLQRQAQRDEHAAFMDALVADGKIRFGGPLGDHRRVLHVVEANDEAVIRARFSEDPWEVVGLLRTADIQLWQILLGDTPKATQRQPGTTRGAGARRVVDGGVWRREA